jgi:hypothetical protein
MQFNVLKDDTAWDNWNRGTIAQARAQDVADVLNPNYVPVTQEELNLFDKKQKFMYALFEKTLMTDKGKSLVRTYQLQYDAQKIYAALQDFALHSTKANLDASSLLQYITTATLGDGNWKGGCHTFVLHWQDQVRKYHDLNPSQTLPLTLQHTLLQNAVHSIPELRAIKVQAEQLKAHTGKDLTYDQYCSLLLSASQQHDRQNLNPSNKQAWRRIYAHQLDTDNYEDKEEYFSHLDYNIDHSIDTMEVYAANFTRGLQLSSEQWHSLPDDAKKTWDMLSPEAKAIILQPRPHLGTTLTITRPQNHSILPGNNKDFHKVIFHPQDTLHKNMRSMQLLHNIMTYVGGVHHLKILLTHIMSHILMVPQ